MVIFDQGFRTLVSRDIEPARDLFSAVALPKRVFARSSFHRDQSNRSSSAPGVHCRHGCSACDQDAFARCPAFMNGYFIKLIA